jgi:hypothetical protein
MAGSRVPDVLNAAVDALKVDATLIGAGLLNGAKVYSSVPEDTVPPYLWVMGGREVIWAEGFNQDDSREVDIDAIAISKYRGTKEVDDIISRVIEVLDTPATWAGVSGYAGHTLVENRAPAFAEMAGEIWIERSLQWRVQVN